VTVRFLQAVLLVLSIGMPTYAQFKSAERATTNVVNSSTLPRVYQRWLYEDVRWIITPEEQIAFLRVSSDEDRDRFIEGFWERRNPKPDRSENEFKEEHYRRLAYANEHFAAGISGWETDRGRVYIVNGAPDRIERLSPGGNRKPAEIWHYRDPSTGADRDFKFVDDCNCGKYWLDESSSR
jgi:GWxTD domain-containing protein